MAHAKHGAHAKSTLEAEGAAVSGDHAAGSPDGEGNGRRGLRVVCVVLCALGAVYVAGVVFFMNFFMPRTTLDGSDVSLRLGTEVASGLSEDIAGYEATVTGDGLSLTVGASDVDLSFDAQSYVTAALQQTNAWAWPYEITRTHSIEDGYGITYDADKLAALLADPIARVNASATQPTNASIGYDATAQRFAVTSETYGTAIDAAQAAEAVGAGICSLDATVALDETSLVQPSVKGDDASLTTAAANANAFLANTISLELGGTQVATVTPSQIKDWVTLASDLSATLDESKVSAWATGELSGQLDTVGTTRTYTRYDGTVITVSGGTYGWCVDGDALATALCDAIEGGTTTSIDVPTKTEGASWSGLGTQDWPASYIDIDLGAQYVRYYDASGSVIWESSCVSGNTSEGHATPTGVYYIDGNMQSGNVKLTGEIDASTGQPEYISYVSYWMPFIGNSVALHDATWRSSFGGSIYTYNGSHGCVNLPYSAAQSLYGMVSVGTVVVCHD